MKITLLIENTTNHKNLQTEHGLSIYIESSHGKTLFDMGRGEGFVYNSQQLGIPLQDVDYAVLSHGHCDHGGGLSHFLKMNNKAKIYQVKSQMNPYYTKAKEGYKYIGLAEDVTCKSVVYTEANHRINENHFLFHSVQGDLLLPSLNEHLFEACDGVMIQDTFNHEQSLVIKEGEKEVLFAGCAHGGIANIMNHYKQITGRYPSHVFGGFHLQVGEAVEEEQRIVELAKWLNETGTVFYTFHCTGDVPYTILKTIMADRIKILRAGDSILL